MPRPTILSLSLFLSILLLVEKGGQCVAEQPGDRPREDLGPVNIPADVKALINQLKDPDEAVRLKAAKALGKLKEKAKAAVPALTKAAKKDPDEDVRTVAQKSLDAINETIDDDERAKLKEKLESIVKKLVRAKENQERVAAIQELAACGPDAKPAGAYLVEFGMMHTSATVREAAFVAFEKIDPLVHKQVLTLLIDENRGNKFTAVQALQDMGSKAKAAVPALKVFFSSNSRGRFVDTSTLKALVAIAPEDSAVKTTILTLVSEEKALPTSVEMMHSIKVTNKQKFNALLAGFRATKFQRMFYIKELGKLGADAKEMLPVLMKLKFDPDNEVRTVAEAAIAAIKD